MAVQSPPLPAIIKTYAPAVTKQLHYMFTQSLQALPLLSRQQEWACAALKDFVAVPGKCVRGSLAAAAFDITSGRHVSSAGLQLGAVVELMHAYVLIIDDVTDQSPLRRGRPSVQANYRRVNRSSAHEADMAAITTGLLAQHLAAEWLADIPVPPEQLLTAQKVLHRMLGTTGLGQLDDLYQHIGRRVTRAQIIRMYEMKTGAYTFAGPLECGLTLAGKTNVHHACQAFGLPAGVAFQLQNDYTDVYGPAARTGPIPDDIRDGRYTLLLAIALDHLSSAERQKFRHILSGGHPVESEMNWIRATLERAEIVNEVKRTGEKYVSQAKQAAHNSTAWNANFANQLAELVDWSCR